MNWEFMTIPIEMQQMENGYIFYDLHKTTCVRTISKKCCEK